MACARAAALLSLSIRHVKRLKKRVREDGEAVLAHANRGRPSPRRLPAQARRSILRLARTTYAGFNDHHLCEKLCELEGFSLSRETLRRLLRQAGLGSPKKRRAPAHRQRRLRSARLGELVQLDGWPHDWLQGRGPRLTLWACKTMPPEKSWPHSFSPLKQLSAISLCLVSSCAVTVCRWPSTAIAAASFVRNDEFWTLQEQLAGQRQTTQFGRTLEQLAITFIAAQSPQAKGRVERLWGVFQDRLTSELRLAGAADLPSANLCSNSSSTTTVASPGRRAKPISLGARRRNISPHLLLRSSAGRQ